MSFTDRDKILMQVQKPTRYTGGEINICRKNPDDVDIRFGFCFPDVYEIGMSHLGIKILYSLINEREDTYCERFFAPWIDMQEQMAELDIPLFSCETKTELSQFDVIGFTLQYELSYSTILNMLDLGGVPLLSKDRHSLKNLVIAGGPCASNPEPIADFFDLFYIGEGETQYRALLDLYKKDRENGCDREIFLRHAALIPGIYVPSLYEVDYHEDGTIASFEPKYSDVPKTVCKEVETNISDTFYPVKPVVPFIKATQDRVTLEIMRGCIRGCRFCQAGQLYRPIRERDLEVLKKYAVEMIRNTGYEELNLSSLIDALISSGIPVISSNSIHGIVVIITSPLYSVPS